MKTLIEVCLMSLAVDPIQPDGSSAWAVPVKAVITSGPAHK